MTNKRRTSGVRLSVIVSCLLLIASVASYSKPPSHISVTTPFDEYGDICWEDEKARLDNFAIQLQRDSDVVGYITVYAGRTSCTNEARTRGERKKRWVLARGVDASRVILRDGGYMDQPSTILQPLRKGMEYPMRSGLETAEVTIIRACKGKVFHRAKCPKR
jgi:hypothetical protein